MGKLSTYPTTAGQHRLTHEPGGEDVIIGIAPGAHEVTHVAGGADDIDSALDARAIALTAQGEIVYHAAAANTLAVLAVGVAGQALLTGGPAANPTWGAPAPAAHVLATTGPHTGELPLTDLAAGVQGNVIHRGAADWAALAVGVAGQALLSGGAGADVSWGAPAPAAHEATHVLGGADAIDSGLDARALNFANQGEIVFRAAAANTLAVLATGVAGQSLLTGGAGADPSWGAPAPAAHESSHVAGGADDIDAALDGRAIGFSEQGDIVYASGATTLAALAHGTAGQALLTGGHGANPSWGAPAPAAHESSHVSGGADDIDSTLDGRAITLTTQGDIVYASGANTLARLAAGTAGQTLQTGGAGANPSWTWDKRLDAAPDANISGNGLTVMAVAGEEVDGGELCYMKADGKYWLTDADAAASMPAVVMATTNIAADATGLFLHIGYYRHDTWDWTLGNGEANLLFPDETTPGAMVQLAGQPAGTGDQVQVVGYVVTADIVFFNPSYELVEIS